MDLNPDVAQHQHTEVQFIQQDCSLPHAMVRAPEYPMFMVKLYLALPFLWRISGRQFLAVAHKPT